MSDHRRSARAPPPPQTDMGGMQVQYVEMLELLTNNHTTIDQGQVPPIN